MCEKALRHLKIKLERGEEAISYRLRGGGAIAVDYRGTGPKWLIVLEAFGIASARIAVQDQELRELAAIFEALVTPPPRTKRSRPVPEAAED